MNEKDNGGPAFGLLEIHSHGGITHAGGMTVRDYFAAQSIAMFQRKVVIEVTAHNGGCTPKQIGDTLAKYAAQVAYEFADAMLEARKK